MSTCNISIQNQNHFQSSLVGLFLNNEFRWTINPLISNKSTLATPSLHPQPSISTASSSITMCKHDGWRWWWNPRKDTKRLRTFLRRDDRFSYCLTVYCSSYSCERDSAVIAKGNISLVRSEITGNQIFGSSTSMWNKFLTNAFYYYDEVGRSQKSAEEKKRWIIEDTSRRELDLSRTNHPT